MPEISRFFGIVIRMYYDEKHGPHLHAKAGKSGASYGFSGRRIVGSLPPDKNALVLAWIKVNGVAIARNWKKITLGEPVEKIPGFMRQRLRRSSRRG